MYKVHKVYMWGVHKVYKVHMVYKVYMWEVYDGVLAECGSL